MTPYLCFSITLLDPIFHGRNDGKNPEWPPSPYRLYQALLNGSHTGGHNLEWNSEKEKCYHWLESQEPPNIIAPDVHPVPNISLFVPNNDSDEEFERNERLTTKITCPQRLLYGQTIHYLWKINDYDQETVHKTVDLLCTEARNIHTFGWGIDMAFGYGRVLEMQDVTALSGTYWKPWKGCRMQDNNLKRIPIEGTLNDLERVYDSFIHSIDENNYRIPLKTSVFDVRSYIPKDQAPLRSYAVFELSEGNAFSQENTVEVGAMLRSLVCRDKNREDFQEQFPNDDSEIFLAGHTGNQKKTPHRFSYLPLPTIGHKHADGMIRRLMIAESYGDNGSHAQWAQQRLKNQVLCDENQNERGLLQELWRTTSNDMVKRYIGESKEWATVTPVLLPGYDDGKHRKAEKLFLQAVCQSGEPVESIEKITLRKAPFFPGSQHPRLYKRPHYLKNLPGWHVRILFRNNRSGPIAIGAGRHCGLGLFARLDY